MAHLIDISPKELWEKYWVEGLNFRECAEYFGVSVGTLKSRFTEWNLPTRPWGGDPYRPYIGDLSDDNKID